MIQHHPFLLDTQALVMDLDGVCYNMVQSFLHWTDKTQFDVKDRLQADMLFPYRYDFWEIFNESHEWWTTKFRLFLEDGGLADPRYTIHGLGMSMWRYANRYGIPVAVVTARHYPPIDTATQFFQWAWDEGLVYDLYIETAQGESKVDAIRQHLDPTHPPSTVVTVEDALPNAQAYSDAGFHSYLVDRPWNQEEFEPPYQMRVYDPSIVCDLSERITLHR